MYNSPIELLVTDIQHQIIKQQDEEIYQAVLHYVPNVDKGELLRALEYDRGQYEKGYADGKADAMNEIVRCNHCRNKEDIPYPKGQVWCRKMGRYMKEDGFCSEGVKMDG